MKIVIGIATDDGRQLMKSVVIPEEQLKAAMLPHMLIASTITMTGRAMADDWKVSQ